jgi:hypothetical protein
VLAAVTFMWRACGGAISEPLRIGADCYFFGDLLKSGLISEACCWRGRFRAGSYFILDTGSYQGPAGDARAMMKKAHMIKIKQTVITTSGSNKMSSQV